MDKINDADLGNFNQMFAEVLFAKSPHSFWVRLEENREEYEEMLKKLQTDYENAHEDPSFNPKTLVPGMLYCSFNRKLFEWHRCEILLVTKNDVSVFNIDIGTTDLIPIKSIKILKEKFKATKKFAVHCSLDNIKPCEGDMWTPLVTNIFLKYTANKTVTLHLKSKSKSIQCRHFP